MEGDQGDRRERSGVSALAPAVPRSGCLPAGKTIAPADHPCPIVRSPCSYSEPCPRDPSSPGLEAVPGHC